MLFLKAFQEFMGTPFHEKFPKGSFRLDVNKVKGQVTLIARRGVRGQKEKDLYLKTDTVDNAMKAFNEWMNEQTERSN